MKFRTTLHILFMLFSGHLFGQCVIDLAPAYCTNAGPVYLPPLHEYGVMSGAGITGDHFFPEAIDEGEYIISYNYAFATKKYYMRSAVGEPWGSTSNINAMNAAFGVDEWTLAEFETADPTVIFSPATGFIFMDGSDDGTVELNDFLIANYELMQDWVAQGGKLLLNAAPNEAVDLDFGFGGAELITAGTINSVTAQNLEHPILSGPNTPVNPIMWGISYGHGYIDTESFTSILTKTGDPSRVVLAERNWGNGTVIVGCMTTSNWHFPAVPAFNWRVNLLEYLNNRRKHYYVRLYEEEPWGGTDNPNAMDLAFGVDGWDLEVMETVDAEEIFNHHTSFVFLEGGDDGGVVLNAFLEINREIIENWVEVGGSLFINAAPNGGGDIDIGFGGVTLEFGEPASSVEVADLTFPALLGPYTPTTPTMMGYSYSHSHVTGEGVISILTETGDPDNIVLGLKEWGNGNVLVGGMTNPSFHFPETEAFNWRSNLLVYANDLFDGFECSITKIVEIVDLPDISLTTDKDSVCFGEPFTLTADGAVYYTWNNPAMVTGIPFIPSISGNNTFIATGEDGLGCVGQDSITIFVNEEIGFETSVTDEVIGGDGAIDLTPNGGIPPFVYDWNIDGTGDFDDLEDIEELTGGTYTVIFKDALECESVGSITVNSQLSVVEFESLELLVYPNPTASFLTIALEGEFNYLIKDMNDRVINAGSGIDSKTLNFEMVADGIYFVTILIGEEHHTVKVVKQ